MLKGFASRLLFPGPRPRDISWIRTACTTLPSNRAPGVLTDHYDPRGRVIRLSPEVYGTQTASAVGIAAHEAGHALQHATHYTPLVIRNAAVPAAKVGPQIFMVSLIIGSLLMNSGSSVGMTIIWFGIAAYGAVFVFQLINLPVEFDASNRAKQLLGDLGIVDANGAEAVRRVLNSAAWTYVARDTSIAAHCAILCVPFSGTRSEKTDTLLPSHSSPLRKPTTCDWE